MNAVKIGIIGCGVIGQAHLRAAAASDAVSVHAVADMNTSAAESVAKSHGIQTVYHDAMSLLNDDRIEGVVLALPACARMELALQAFERGKHVLIEKPPAMNAQEVIQMIEARGELVGACCCSRYDFLESTQVATKFIALGKLGELRLLRCHAICEIEKPPTTPRPVWRLKKSLNGGGIMANWGCYDLNYLMGITGWTLKPQSVLGQIWPIAPCYQSYVAPGSDAETHAVATIQCEGGEAITFDRGEYVAARSTEAWQIIGTQGSLRLQMTNNAGIKTIEHDKVTPDGVVTETIWVGREYNGTLHAGPIVNFAQAIRGKQAPTTSLEKALVIQQIIDAIYESSESRTSVEIEPYVGCKHAVSGIS